MLDWMKHKLESRLLGRNINNLKYGDDTTLKGENEEELKILLINVKLEHIIQSEVSQKEKHHYSILTHIYGI